MKYKDIKKHSNILKLFDKDGKPPKDNQETGYSVFIWKDEEDNQDLMDFVKNN